MKTLVGKDALNRMALCVCFLSALPIAQGAEPITITMTADHWQTKENAEFLRQLGFYHGLMRLNSGNAVLKGITFSDGTIEFDVNTIGRGAPGIAFRQQDEGNFELLYLRPDPSCPAFRACIQYAPQTHGVLLWDLFPQYQTNSGGLGLSVTRQRVEGLYPDGETCFAVNRRASGGTEVEISLPLRWTGKDAHAAVHV